MILTQDFIKKRIKEQKEYITLVKARQYTYQITYERARILLESAVAIKNYFEKLLK